MKKGELVNIVLNDMYNIIKSTLSNNVYSFKGGFILKKVLDSRQDLCDTRRTTDIDMSILDEVTFNVLKDSLLPYVEDLKTRGIIYSYKFKTPERNKNGRNVSGGLKLYIKPENDSSKKRILCGIDMSIHPLNYGVVIFNDGSSVYSLERMLADKFCVMYLEDRKLLRRIRDVSDIYLIMQYLGSISNLNVENVVIYVRARIKESSIIISSVSTLERMFMTSEGYSSIKNSFENLIDSTKVSSSIISKKDIDLVLKDVIKFINYIYRLI